MKKLPINISDYFEPIILDRGSEYYKEERVNKVELSENFVSAKIKGDENYHVWISFDKELTPLKMSCTCSYFKKNYCKHLAALFYHLDDNDYFSEANKTKDDETNTELESNKLSAINNTGILQTKFPSLNKSPKNQLHSEIDNFKTYFSPFIENSAQLDKKEPAKTNTTQYGLAYGIDAKGYRSEIFPLRLRLRKDGTIADKSKAHSISYKTIPYLDLNEKLIVDYLLGYDNSTLYLGSYQNSRDDSKKREMFNEILTFLSDKKVYFESKYENYKNVNVLKNTAECVVTIDEDMDDLVLELSINIDGESITNHKNILTVLDEPLWIYVNDKIFHVNNLSYKQLELFINEEFKILISKDHLSLFETELLPRIVSTLPIVSNKYEIEEVSEIPVKKILLEESDSNLLIKVKFSYGNVDLDYIANEGFTTIFNDNKILKIKRDNEFENNALAEVQNLYVKKISNGVFTPRNEPIDFLLNHFSDFEEMGFEILGEEKLNKLKINTAKPKISFNVTSGIDWFDVTTDIEFNGTTVPFSELVAAIKHKKKYLKLSDGSTSVLPTNWIRKIQQTLSLGELENNSVRFSNIQALALDSIINDADKFEADEKFNEHIDKLKSFEKIKKQSVPRSFKGKLRDYQKFGLDWLYFLQEYSFGGILADDMGLGKTIQSIVLLLKEKSENKNYTNLIVAPTSVIFNWIDEINKFAPDLTILSHNGINRKRKDSSAFENYDIVITSYGVMLRDFDLLQNFQFHYIVLDESQKIKNPYSKTGRVTRKLKADYRLCLTGTPIENNLTELWSQMAFLNPGLLGSFKKFNDTFVKAIPKERDSSTIKLLQQTIYPFILRRTKDVVAKDLPEKTETIHYCELEKDQERVYNFWKNSIRAEIQKEIKEKGIKKSGFKVLEGLLRLRQICNHPVLVDTGYNKKSAKFEEFKTMLTKVVAEGHKVLVFSQFVKMLELMQTHLDKNGIKYELLRGSTRNREERVKNFKEDDSIKIFLISLKAGGFGLNLTEADYVFHYDPWWNPAVETQATDRTHRIGQSKNVFVYKFITKNTIEEKILHLQAKKQKMVQEIISTESSLLKNLTQKDISILFE